VTLVRTVAEARAWAEERRRRGERVALVATMGALHAGHLALVEACRSRARAVVMSVFVNPTQFGPGEDYARYPRDLDRDAALAAEAGVDLLFAPSVEEMYPVSPEVFVEVGRLGTILEGQFRPTHFRGVATVVTKLLIVLTPDLAAFGQKDAQQVVVVRRLVRELLLPTEIVCVPTVREPDGLAMSSRNAYLSPAERRAAPVLYAALQEGAAAVRAGERRPAAVEDRVRRVLAREPLVRPDYVAAVSAADLEPPPELQGRVLLLVAARLPSARLIDNLCLEVRGAEVLPALP
jgi:pantoate--beta-alanine ligase